MTEQPKKENWKEEVAKIVNETFQKNLDSLKSLIPKETPSQKTPEKPHSHWKAEDLGGDCPECQKEVQKIGENYLRKTLEERKAYPHECVNCGLGVKADEQECPNCKSTKARPK